MRKKKLGDNCCSGNIFIIVTESGSFCYSNAREVLMFVKAHSVVLEHLHHILQTSKLRSDFSVVDLGAKLLQTLIVIEWIERIKLFCK